MRLIGRDDMKTARSTVSRGRDPCKTEGECDHHMLNAVYFKTLSGVSSQTCVYSGTLTLCWQPSTHPKGG